MKKVALINDLSGFGKCSLTAAIPVISAMGHQACPLPTAILSAQTGFDDFFCDDYTNRMNDITDHWVKMDVKFDGIYSGYLGSADQIENVLYFLDKFKADDVLFLADPVMGDNGKCFKIYSNKLLETMKELTKNAKIITPNLTEICLLAGADYDKLLEEKNKKEFLKRILDVAKTVQNKANCEQTVVVTGVVSFCENDNEIKIGNLIVKKDDESFYESPYTRMSFSGTGDLFASVVTGALMSGLNVDEAVLKAMSFLQPAIEEATKNNIPRNHGVLFEKYLSVLMN